MSYAVCPVGWKPGEKSMKADPREAKRIPQSSRHMDTETELCCSLQCILAESCCAPLLIVSYKFKKKKRVNRTGVMDMKIMLGFV